MRILFLTRYAAEGPSSRYRFLQYIPYLESAGIHCVVAPFFRPGYLSPRFSSGNRSGLMLHTLSDYWNRLRILCTVRKYDLVFIEKEIFPYLPPIFENPFFHGGPPTVLDYDDAIFHVYDSHANFVVRLLLGNKIPRLMAKTKAVVVGSNYLYEYACRYNGSSCLLPTVIDLKSYPDEPPLREAAEPFTVGWIGSNSTVMYLRSIAPVLDKFCATHNARFVMIGGNSDPLLIRHLSSVPWSRDAEIRSLSKIDVGIMPLDATPFARGKCAFKLIQYMGCWKPVIATPVGENARVVEHGVNGFLADTPQQWFDALELLFGDPTLCQTMGARGRVKVEAEYSLAVTAPRLVEILKRSAGEVDYTCVE